MSRQGTIRRYTLIIEKVSRSNFPTFKDIQNYLFEFGFEISKRTIERDIEAIRTEFGFEITYNHTEKGYFVDEDNSINIESFLRFLEIVNTAELLTESLSDSKQTLNYISFDKGGGLKGIELLRPLLKATKEHRIISFNHFNYQTEVIKDYVIEPYLLKEYQNRWYIVGLVPEINEMRTFGIDRLNNLKILSKIFKYNDKLNPIKKFEDAIGLYYGNSIKEKVLLSFNPDQSNYLKSLPLHHSQKILIDNDSELKIELNIVPNYELIQLILMQNKNVKVIEPKWLNREIKLLLSDALKQYK